MKELLERLVKLDPERFTVSYNYESALLVYDAYECDAVSYCGSEESTLSESWLLRQVHTLDIRTLTRPAGKSWEESILTAIVEKMEEGK